MDLARKNFAEQKELATEPSYGTFQYWHKNYKAHISEVNSGAGNFVSLTCDTNTTTDENLKAEVIYPTGIRVVFNQVPSVTFLKSLLQ